ncbi:MAG: hypothetical protein JWN48_1943 [Myxococcaceae bacterium]|nr:hypothetical protein [Myxococcaceae bacterium]
MTQERVEVGFQTFVSDGGEEFGSVLAVSDHSLIVYVENAGEFMIPRTAVRAVHSSKVILDVKKLEPKLRAAIGHAHDAEDS